VLVEIIERGARSVVYWELDGVDDPRAAASFLEIDVVESLQRLPTMYQVWGKRIIVVGAGAQVGQVAIGAIGEADRHNIRGEKISVDTIPIVGRDQPGQRRAGGGPAAPGGGRGPGRLAHGRGGDRGRRRGQGPAASWSSP
jgi:hypothetical protein